MEEDLSRLMGDAPAHALMQGVRGMAQALRQFAGASAGRGGSGGGAA
jgi:ubiquinone biosynthesis protein UbiJ